MVHTISQRLYNSGECGHVLCRSENLPFTWGKKQLSKFEMDTARQLSCVRIHVERVIGVM